MIIERLYGTATSVRFPLIAFSATSFHNSLTTTMFAAGDFKIALNDGDFTNTATLPSTCPGGKSVVLTLTAAELSAAKIEIQVVDSVTKVWEDQALLIETYGHASSQHAFNRNQTAVQASLTAAQTGVTIATVTDVTNTVKASLTAAQTGVTVATVTDVTNTVKASLTAAQTGVTIATVTDVTNTVKSSLTAAQVGVTIATVTDITNGVKLTTTAILSNLGASATAQINAEADAALADASVTAVAMNKIHSATDAASAVFAATLTSSSFSPDTGGYRLSLIDIAVSVVDDGLVSIVSPWRGNVNAGATTTAVTLGVLGDTPSTVDDFYNGNLIHIQTNGTQRARTYRIVDYNGTTKDVTMDRALEGTMTHGNGYIVRDGGESIATEKTGFALTSAERSSIADSILDRTDGIETSWSLRQSLRVILAANAGKLSGAATTAIAIRDVGDTKNRISATVDASGNRSAVTLDAS